MIKRQLRGISLSNPLAYAFAQPVNPMRIINRTEQPEQWVLDQGVYVALHAYDNWDQSIADWLAHDCRIVAPPKDEHPVNHIFAVALLYGVTDHDEDVMPGQDIYFKGPYALLLRDYVRLHTPVECPGALGLWTLDRKRNVVDQIKVIYRETLARQREEILEDAA